MQIKQITRNKKAYLPLLLIGDEQESMIDRYLQRGDMFVLLKDEDAVAEVVVTNEGGGTYEIKNIAVASAYRKKGYARRMVDFILDFYAPYIRLLKAGTAETPEMDRFYKHLGFEQKGRIADFFTNNYDHPIIECGIRLKDMIYYEKACPCRFDCRRHLDGRLHERDIAGLCHLARHDDQLQERLYELIFDENSKVAANAAWVWSHLCGKARSFFTPKRLQPLLNLAVTTTSDTMCRLLLNIVLNCMTFQKSLLPDGIFLDFCLHNATAPQRPPATRVLCLKLAYEMSRIYPEIGEELQQCIALIKREPLPPSLTCACKKLSHALQKQEGV